MISAKDFIDSKNKKLYWHNGGTGGYRSCLVFHKESKKAVLVLSNISAFHGKSSSLDNLCFSLFKKLMKSFFGISNNFL